MTTKTKENLTYRTVGDFRIPNLTLPPEEDTLVEQMKETEGVTEQLKEENQLEWVQRMNNLQQRAREVVFNEFVYK